MEPTRLCPWCGKERHATRDAALAVTCDCEPTAVQRAGDDTWDHSDRTGDRLISGLSAAAPQGGELPVVAD